MVDGGGRKKSYHLHRTEGKRKKKVNGEVGRDKEEKKTMGKRLARKETVREGEGGGGWGFTDRI